MSRQRRDFEDKVSLKAVKEEDDDEEAEEKADEKRKGKLKQDEDEDYDDACEEEKKQSAAAKAINIDDKGWELTWPIWHMLPWQERKELANKYGYKSIGEFEEYMSLKQAVGDTTSSVSTPYSNELAYNHTHETATTNAKIKENEDSSKQDNPKLLHNMSSTGTATTTTMTDEDNEEDEDNDEEDEDYFAQQQQEQTIEEGSEIKKVLSEEEYAKHAGLLIVLLPDELLHAIFHYLHVDIYSTLALVSPHWKHLTRTEEIYKKLCQRIYCNKHIYSNNAKKQPILRPLKFKHCSYREMLQHRPRIRIGGGIYVLKYSRVKKIQRDMWTEIPVGAILETTYYRYLYFLEDGRLLYSLTTHPPQDMFKSMHTLLLEGKKDDGTNESIITHHNNNNSNHRHKKHGHHKHGNHHHSNDNNQHRIYDTSTKVVWGTYSVQRNKLTILARQSWQTVKFQLSIVMDQPYYHYGSQHTRFGMLKMEKHLTSVSGHFPEDETDPFYMSAFNDHDIVQFEVPDEYFRFIKDARF